MQKRLVDRKSWWSVGLLTLINEMALAVHFRKIEIEGKENLPKSGPFLLISNHCSRWDPPLVHKVLARKANYMASPNEMKGLQGALIPGIGAFTASASRESVDFIFRQVRQQEVLMIFPEGNVFRDGTTHAFKIGSAKIALMCNEAGVNMPIVPMAIRYIEDGPRTAKITVGAPIDVSDYLEEFKKAPNVATRSLTSRLHREICHLKISLGQLSDRESIYTGKPVREWMPRLQDAARSTACFDQQQTA